MSLRVRLALAAILLLALALRGMEARSGLPYLHHFDEPSIGHRALDVLRTGDWNPHFFHYPSLLIYLNVGVDVLHYFRLMSRPDGDPETLGSLDELKTGPDDDPWFISHPSFYLWNRRLTALFGTASVLLTFLLARRLRGPPGRAGAGGSAGFSEADLVGLLAAVALATLPFHVVQSAFVSTDVPASTLALAAVFFSVRFVQDRRPWDLAWAALLVGLAASTKYNLASALAVPAVALIGARFGPRLGRGADTDQGSSPPTRPWLWAALVALPAVGFLVGTPYALFDLRTFLDHAGYEVRHYLVLGHDPMTVEPGWPHLVADLEKLVDHAGMWLVLPALAGVAVALRRRAGWVAFLLPALQLLLTARTSVDFHRNLLVLYPFTAVAFGLGVVALEGWLGRGFRRRGPRWRRPAVVGFWILVALLLGGRTVRTLAASWRTASTPETRSQAVDEINSRAAAAKRQSPGPPVSPLALRIASELELHPLDLERLELPFRVKPLVEIACEPEPRTRVLVPRRVSTWIADRQPEVDRINGLLERGGPEVFAIPGRDTVLTHFSTDPAVVLRQPWSWPDGEPPAAECASPAS